MSEKSQVINWELCFNGPTAGVPGQVVKLTAAVGTHFCPFLVWPILPGKWQYKDEYEKCADVEIVSVQVVGYGYGAEDWHDCVLRAKESGALCLGEIEAWFASEPKLVNFRTYVHYVYIEVRFLTAGWCNAAGVGKIMWP